MDQIKNKIYARINEISYVEKFFSSVFETPLSSDVLVEEGNEEYHAHVHLKYRVFDNDGCYLYKYVYGQITESTEEERLAQLNSKIDINSLKQNKIMESKIALSIWLKNNPVLFSDGKYYSITQEKQSLLNNALAIYQLKSQVGMTDIELKWNSTGEECSVWTIENLSMLALSIAGYVEPLISHQQSLELQIKNCTTKAELDGIVIAYETIT